MSLQALLEKCWTRQALYQLSYILGPCKYSPWLQAQDECVLKQGSWGVMHFK